jgi:predicted permease
MTPCTGPSPSVGTPYAWGDTTGRRKTDCASRAPIRRASRFHTVNEIVSAILPVFLVVAAVYLVRRCVPLHAKTLSSLNIYLFIPALVYSSISQREIQWDVFGRIALGALFMLGSMTVVLGAVARWLNIDPKERGAFLMSLFPNLGNFGLPVCMFAFGEAGLAFGVVIMVCGSFLQNSVGIYFAQRAHLGMSAAFKRVFAFPMVYAFILALITQRWGLHFGTAVDRALTLTANAMIPIQLAILGVQLAETRLETTPPVFIAAAIRLIGGPILAAGVVLLVGLDGLAAKTFITQMSGPVAIGVAAYGVQFDVAPRFLASVVSWSFLFSIFTVAAVLFVLSHVTL